MVYPDTRCWDNHPDGIDPDNYDTNHGVLQTAFKSMFARVTGSGGNDGSDLETWLGEQSISAHDEECVAKFRMSVVEGSQNKRLFHGHDCGSTLGYTLVSQIRLPLGTWDSDMVSDFSQSPDSACEADSDG